MSLNSGFHFVSTNTVSAADQALIDEFFARGGKVKHYQPANVAESETVRATNEHIAQKRKEFRASRKAKKGN